MVVDLFLVYQFIRRLATPFNKWKAYELGVIDDKGEVLVKKKDRDSTQRKAWGIFDRMVANLKKLLAKVPGGSSKLASYAAALYLIKEWNHFSDESMLNEDISDEQLDESILLFSSVYLNYINEDQNVKALFQEACWNGYKQVGMKKKNGKDVPNCVPEDKELEEASAPIKWKKAGPDGEIEATVKGQRFKIQKALDHNLRHKGEYKVYIWDKRSDDWEWDDTLYGKTNAKARVFFHLKENKVNTKPELEEEPANNVGSGNIAGMDGGHMSKAGQKKWTSSNKTKKKKIRDMMGDLK